LRKERKMYLYSNQPNVPVCPRTSVSCPAKTKKKTHSLAIVKVKKKTELSETHELRFDGMIIWVNPSTPQIHWRE